MTNECGPGRPKRTCGTGLGTLVNLHHSSTIKSQQVVTKQCFLLEESGAGAGFVLVTVLNFVINFYGKIAMIQ
jgi:hypothetical protein